ncbi:large conductance mechanosensitive channel protein MscL [Paenibacillus sp. NEAU-GSW1]|uniref:large conductance mechanosensitive channel protein MscL n=1 Tax=Paenibacillus sp. NEAU-GSW1 TaxID=2682486 RepID=UPI0012E1DB9D|nr:large conductance mechanosensitive channel protein MscL [Paenibacillus sp. NEAU-GSW1]MUT65995.1 large conductance mechanosensitive channel protein MscL [Paenibacillus sp. NEAU-GSW1]
MKIIQEFKEFAVKGNVIDLAVGVIIGAAFGKIVTSLVNDIIMPPIGRILGGANFKDLYINLDPAKTAALEAKTPSVTVHSLKEATDNGIAVIAYGQFINVLLDFLIVSICIFFLVKFINVVRRIKPTQAEPEAAPTEKECPYCLSQVPIKATRCKHCTSQLDATATSV